MNETLVERLPPIVDIGPERQLFLDDHLIDSMTRVARYVHQPDRHPENPILVAEHPWEGQRLLYSDVVFDPDETIYKLWYSVYDPQIEESNLCYAVSEDGIHWKNLEEPILDVGNTMLDTHNLCTYDPYEGHYVAYLRGHLERRRLVRRAEGTDFRQLNPARPCLMPDPGDPFDDDIYTPCYCPYPGRQLYLMFPSLYHRISSTVDVQLAVSHDSYTWLRPERRPIIDLHNEEGDDYGCIYAAQGGGPLRGIFVERSRAPDRRRVVPGGALERQERFIRPQRPTRLRAALPEQGEGFFHGAVSQTELPRPARSSPSSAHFHRHGRSMAREFRV